MTITVRSRPSTSRSGLALAGLALGLLVHCGTPAREPEPASTRIALEGFPSTSAVETGVHHWDLGRVTTDHGEYVVARGYAIAGGTRAATLEIVSRSDGSARSLTRGPSGEAVTLPTPRAQAVARDLEAMAAALDRPTRVDDPSRQSLRILAGSECDAGAEGSLLAPCATELVGCAEELRASGAAARGMARDLGGDPAARPVDPAAPPPAATLADGASALDRRCAEGGFLEPNDVSVLVPFRRGDPGFRRLIPLGDFLPQPLFDQVKETAESVFGRAHFADPNPQPANGVWATDLELPVSGPNGPVPLGASHLGNWRIVSFRFDPCAPPAAHLVPVPTATPVPPNPNINPATLPPPYDAAADRPNLELCTVELRLVAQPFRYYEPETQARDGDTTMHLFYRYGEPGSPDVAARDAIVRGLRALKEASPVPTGGALGPHPGLASDGDGRLMGEVARFLREQTARSRISQIAFMGLRTPVVRGFAGRGEDGGPNMWNFFVGRVSGERFEQLDIHPTWAFRWDPSGNRYLAGPENVEVVALAPASGYPGVRTALTQADVDAPDVLRATVRNATCRQCHASSGGDTRLVNFGYVSGTPSIAQRTVVETNAVVRAILGFANAR